MEGKWSPARSLDAQPFMKRLNSADLKSNFKKLNGKLVKWHGDSDASMLNGVVLGMNEENLVIRIITDDKTLESLND